MKTIRILLVETTRTDLMCIACGAFRTDFAVVNDEDLVRSNADSETLAYAAVTGLHRQCIKHIASRQRRLKREITNDAK